MPQGLLRLLPHYLLFSFCVTASVLGNGWLVQQTTPTAWALQAFRSAGLDLAILANSVVAALVGSVYAAVVLCLAPLSRSEMETVGSPVLLQALLKLLVVVFILEPSTEEEVALWALWFGLVLAVQATTEIAKVRMESVRQVQGVGSRVNRGLLDFLVFTALGSSGLIVLCVYLFSGADFLCFTIVACDAVQCQLTAAQSGLRYAVLLKAAGCFGPSMLFDAEEWLSCVDLLTELPRSVISVVHATSMLGVNGFSVLALALLKNSAVDVFGKLRRLQTRTQFAGLFPLAKPREVRAYQDPCAVCYEHLCLDVGTAGWKQLAAEDASVAAAVAAAAASVGAQVDVPATASDGAAPPEHELLDAVHSAASSPGSSPRRPSPTNTSNILLGQRRGWPRVPPSLCPRVLPCGHIFHHKCLCRWLEEKRECPICKRPVQLAATPPSQQQPSRGALTRRLIRLLMPRGLTFTVRYPTTRHPGGLGAGSAHAAASAHSPPASARGDSGSDVVLQIQQVFPNISRERVQAALRAAGGDANLAVHNLIGSQ